MPEDVSEFLSTCAARTEERLRALLWRAPAEPRGLIEAMEYSLMAGGKRLRPALALGAARAAGADDAVAMPAACALEMIHTYSLIHDDLPAMDNDDLRRGRPTAHKAFGEATAILAGDSLLTLAFEVLADAGNAAVIREIAHASGVCGMAGGQFIDLQSEGKQLTLDALREIHRCKTGALIRASVRAGALLANAPAHTLDALTAYGEHIGLAFQIADDILDVVGDEAAIGKPVGSDIANEKATYPALLGLDRSRVLAREAADAAVAALAPLGPEADIFRSLADFIVDRNH
jgi:geranylgeranyl diphosphate synthase type II